MNLTTDIEAHLRAGFITPFAPACTCYQLPKGNFCGVCRGWSVLMDDLGCGTQQRRERPAKKRRDMRGVG